MIYGIGARFNHPTAGIIRVASYNAEEKFYITIQESEDQVEFKIPEKWLKNVPRLPALLKAV